MEMERLNVVRGSTPTDGTYLEHYFRYQFAAPLAAGKSVLDCACGTGYGTYLLSQTARDVVGVDNSVPALEMANGNWATSNIRYQRMDACDLRLLEREWDVVVSLETIEHLERPATFLEAAHDCLKPGGLLIVSTPDKDNYRSGLQPNRYHVREFTRSEFVELLSERFETIRLFGQVSTGNTQTRSDRQLPSASRTGRTPLRSRMVESVVRHPIAYAAYLYRMKKRFSVVPIQHDSCYSYLVAVCKKG